jgi:predicted transcriptional regulator
MQNFASSHGLKKKVTNAFTDIPTYHGLVTFVRTGSVRSAQYGCFLLFFDVMLSSYVVPDISRTILSFSIAPIIIGICFYINMRCISITRSVN